MTTENKQVDVWWELVRKPTTRVNLAEVCNINIKGERFPQTIGTEVAQLFVHSSVGDVLDPAYQQLV